MAPLSFSGASLLCECLGTFLLVLTVGCNQLSETPEEWAVTSVACALMVVIYATASISGGHMNPAVTLAMLLSRRCGFAKAFAYIISQFLGGILAGVACMNLFLADTKLGPADGFAWWQACVAETIYTAMLALVVLCVTSAKNNPEHEPNQFYGLAIGFVVIAGGYGAGGISGGAFNPAISIGLGALSRVDQCLLYILYQTIGSVLAVLLFRALRPEDRLSASEQERYVPSISTRMLCEFIGSFLLVLTVGLNVLGKSAATAWSVGAALVSMVYSLGDVSGGHFNPAVTLTVVTSRKTSLVLKDLIAYWLAQIAGGVLAGVMFMALHTGKTFALGPKDRYGDAAVFVMEFTFTLIICLTVLSVACTKGISSPLTRNNYYGLAIGSAVTAGGFATAKISGGCLNPAVSFGVGISNMSNDGIQKSSYMITYSAAQLAGGICATLLFMTTHKKEYRKTIDRRLFVQRGEDPAVANF
eukprot:TRINITY_DN17921_c0_g1_i1.p1 TRINITY_DN17921_c0_g1~~TRINITY_DN17921_c0_g1_i1.p1  ORF type:complete len:473 (+),score=59.90 TRINITY_DN17921_c0_g1_i1:144-1562(+)